MVIKLSGIEMIPGLFSPSGAVAGSRPYLTNILGETKIMASAEIISRSLNIPIQTVPGMEEIDFGLWEGASYGDLMKSYPKEFPFWIDNSCSKRPPGGESLEDLQRRVLKTFSFLKCTVEEEDDKSIVIVSHRGPLIIILLDFLELGLENFWHYKIERGSISKLNIYPRFSELDFLNRKF